jgi:hypothetical protein
VGELRWFRGNKVWGMEEIGTYSSGSRVVDWAGIEARAFALARLAEVALHSGMEAGEEVELQSVAHISSRTVGREGQSALADIDLDNFRDCGASCH